MPDKFRRVRITDCPHQAIHEDMEGDLVEQHSDSTGVVAIGDKVCHANSWTPVKPTMTRKTTTANRTKLKPVHPMLEIRQVESDRYSLNYAGRADSSLSATNISIQELEMALNAIQLLQASQ